MIMLFFKYREKKERVDWRKLHTKKEEEEEEEAGQDRDALKLIINYLDK